MTYDDLLKLYEKAVVKYGKEAYRHISSILIQAKKQHKKRFKGIDHEQSWKAFKGKNLEKLIQYIIVGEIKNLGLDVVNGSKLERTLCANLPNGLAKVKRNLFIDYGIYGAHLPDVDIVIYNPSNSKVIAVLSVKVTLRERIAQTGYWKIKLASDKLTQHIKVYFITPDEDGTLSTIHPIKKARAIVEADIDGSYVLSEKELETSSKVKPFSEFINDLKKLIK